MVFSTAAVVLALAVNGVAPQQHPTTASAPLHQSIAQQPVSRPVLAPKPLERWQIDAPESRPAALPILYASLGALHVADTLSTQHALKAGAREANPLMRTPARDTGAMLAVKALSMTGTIYFAERAWKKNRKGAVVLMAVINGVTAAVTARNIRNAR